MKSITICIAIMLSACSSPILKKCPAKVLDRSLLTCPEQVSGEYRKCEKPVDLYQCEDLN